MMKRVLGSMLGTVIALALTACAQPARVAKTGAHESSTVAPGVTIANPRVGEATGGGPFPPLPSGYRGLGGAFMNQGTLVVVAPDMKAPMQKHDLDVGLLHGMSAGGYSETAAAPVQAPDCQGSGNAPESAIKVEHLAEVADEVTAGIACARMLHPGTHWLMSQLVTKGDGYLSQVALRDADGHVVIVYTDINRLANQLIDELGG
jgi:hypothetical protein